MGGVSEINFLRMQTRPFGAQTTRKVATDGRRNHRHHDEIEAGADFECRCRDARVSPRGYDCKANARAERQQDQSEGQ